MKTIRLYLAMFAAALIAVCGGGQGNAAGVRANVSAGLTGQYIGSTALGTATALFNINQVVAFSEGSAANQAQYLYTAQPTIAASGSSNIDLAGATTDALGATLTCTTVKFIYVKAAAANTNNVLVGGAGSNTFINWVGDATDIVVVKPGGFLLLVAPGTGYAVTAATGDLLKLANSSSGTGVTADVAIGCI